MNQFWLSVFCVATLVSSAMSEIICNGAPGLRESSAGKVACYSSEKASVNEYLCDWASCTQATGTDCTINDHPFTKNAVFTCDKAYNLPTGVDDKIICNANTDYKNKCGDSHSEPCLQGPSTSYQAACKKIVTHSHCKTCKPI